MRTLPCVAAFLVRDTQREITPACPTEDTVAIQDAIAYVIEPYGELTEKNGAPSLLRRIRPSISSLPIRPRATRWLVGLGLPRSRRRRPDRPGPMHCDDAYRRIRANLESAMQQPVFTRAGREAGDRL